MSILPARLRQLGIGVALALTIGACSARPAEVRGTFAAEGLPRVDVSIATTAEHAGQADRYRYAAFSTLRTLGVWLVPFPDATLSITADRTPWWTAAAAMAPEYAVARAVGRRYWARVVDTRAMPPWFVEGLAEYSARRAVSKIVDERYLTVARSRGEGRYFGGFVPRDLRVPLRVEDEGDPVGTEKTREARALLALGTLERWTGRPVFDAILMEFVRASAGSQPTLDDFAHVAARVSGQDLSWFFDETLKRAGSFDYGIETLESEPQADGSYRTRVSVRRLGDGVFSGANVAPDDVAGPFEHGQGIALRMTFADGEIVRDAWDGRSRTRTFEYRSPSRARSAEVDPDRILLLDRNRSNNGITLETSAARSAAGRWAARWMLWMEDALLTYVSLT